STATLARHRRDLRRRPRWAPLLAQACASTGKSAGSRPFKMRIFREEFMSARVNPNGKLAGKVALVPGASRGIGEAISARLAQEGAKVVASARTAEAGDSRLPGTLHDTVDRIRKAGG